MQYLIDSSPYMQYAVRYSGRNVCAFELMFRKKNRNSHNRSYISYGSFRFNLRCIILPTRNRIFLNSMYQYNKVSHSIKKTPSLQENVNKQNHTLTQGNNIKSYVNCVLDVKNAINLITDTTQRLSVINTYIKIPLLQACREMTFFFVLFATLFQ